MCGGRLGCFAVPSVCVKAHLPMFREFPQRSQALLASHTVNNLFEQNRSVMTLLGGWSEGDTGEPVVGSAFITYPSLSQVMPSLLNRGNKTGTLERAPWPPEPWGGQLGSPRGLHLLTLCVVFFTDPVIKSQQNHSLDQRQKHCKQ